MKHFLLLALFVFAFHAKAQEAAQKRVPAEFWVPLNLIKRSSDNHIPLASEAINIGSVASDHFKLHGRRFEVVGCQTSMDGDKRLTQIISRPDTAGGYSIVIIQFMKNGSPSKIGGLIIAWHPMNAAEEEGFETYGLLLP